MKKTMLLSTMLFASLSTFAQPGLQKLWASDTVNIKGPETALFDQKSKSLYVSNMATGTVVQLDLKGKLLRDNIVTGLNSNKGSAIYKGLFYTAELQTLTIINLAKGTIVKRIPVEGAGMLNDVTVDAKGVIYVSDTRTGKVHRVEGESVSLYLEGIEGVNGVLAVGTDLYVAGADRFLKVAADKKLTTIADGFESGLDGIVMISKDEFILSNYKGMIYYVTAAGDKKVLSDTRAEGISTNDIDYDPKTRTLFVASMRTNRIIAYQVK